MFSVLLLFKPNGLPDMRLSHLDNVLLGTCNDNSFVT